MVATSAGPFPFPGNLKLVKEKHGTCSSAPIVPVSPQVRNGAKIQDIRRAWTEAIARNQPQLSTPLAQAAARAILAPKGAPFWSIHTVGLRVDDVRDILRTGMVVAYEPIVSAQGQGFYLEDMLLITREGYEVLTPGLPYTAEEIEQAMNSPSSRRY